MSAKVTDHRAKDHKSQHFVKTFHLPTRQLAFGLFHLSFRFLQPFDKNVTTVCLHDEKLQIVTNNMSGLLFHEFYTGGVYFALFCDDLAFSD